MARERVGVSRPGRPSEWTTSGVTGIRRNVTANRRRLAAWIVTLAIVCGALLLRWGGEAAILLGLLSGSLAGIVDRRLSVAIGLLCLALCPLLLVAEQNAWLQQSTLVNYYASTLGLSNLSNAVAGLVEWAYYLLCIGVVAHLVRYTGQALGRRGGRQNGRTT